MAKIGELSKKDMRKIQRISDLEPTIAFSEFDFYQNYQQSFSNRELGRLHKAIPFVDLATSLGLQENSIGRDSYFSPTGKLALIFLKPYTGLSDSQS